MEARGHLPDMETMPANIAAKDATSRPGSTSDSSTDFGTIPAARAQQQANLELDPLGAAAASKLSVEQHLNQGLADLRTLQQCVTSEPAAEPPAKDLTDVSHRLKKLERAVKAHLLGGPRIAGDASILASACGGSSILSQAVAQHQRDSNGFAGFAAGDPPIPGIARLSERSRLKETLSDIKSDIADLAVRQVEEQLLKQRVLRLEAAIGGFGGLGSVMVPAAAAGVSSSFTSFSGTMASPGVGVGGAGGGAGGGATAVSGPREDAAPTLRRSPSDVSVLVNRLAGMEGIIKELAQAQVANTAVLQQIGGRLPSPVPQSPDNQCYSTAAVGCFAPPRGSPARSYPRPPSCPLIGGLLNSPFGYSPPEAAQPRGRAPSPDAFNYPCSSFANTTAYGSPNRAGSVCAGSCASSVAGPKTTAQACAYPAIPALPATSQPAAQQQQQQDQTEYPTPWEQPLPQQRPQQQWQVEVVLAGHDADIAQVKEAVQQLGQHQQAADATTAAQVCGLADRVAALEQSIPVVEQLPETTLRHMLQPAEGKRAATADAARASCAAVAAAVGTLDQADLLSAIEGLAADAVQATGRLDVLEDSLERQLVSMDDLNDMKAQLHQALNTMAELSAKVQSLQTATAASPADNPGSSAPAVSTPLLGIADTGAHTMASSVSNEQVQQQVLHQLFNSTRLQQLINAKVEQLLQSRVEEAVAAQLAEAAGHAADMAALAAEAFGAASSPAQSKSRLQALLSDDSAEDVGSFPSAVSCCPTPRVPRKLQDAFDSLSERLQKMQSHAAAGQAEVIHEAVQHLHNRLLQVEEVVAQNCKGKQHQDTLQSIEQKVQQQPVTRLAAGSSFVEQHSSPDHCDSVAVAAVSHGSPLLADTCDAATATADELSGPADSAPEKLPERLPPAGTDIRDVDVGSSELADNISVQWPKLFSGDGAPEAEAALSSDMDTVAAADIDIAAEASSASTDHLERQVAALHQEVTSHQVTELQAAVEELCKQMATMQQALAQQAIAIDQQKVSTAASFAVLSPLEPRVCELEGQLAVLSDIAAQQPSKLEALQNEIEQLSRQLAEVNEGAADEAELTDLKALIDSVTAQQGEMQSQLHATQTVAAAAVQAATSAANEAATMVAAAQNGTNQGQKEVEAFVPAAAEQLKALEASVQQQLASTQESLAELQQEVEGRVAEAVAKAASYSAESQALSERAGALTSKLAALEVAALEVAADEDKAATHCLLTQKVHELHTAAAAHEGQLHSQMEAMAQVLNDQVQANAAQADATQQLQQQFESLHEAQTQAAALHLEVQSSLSHQLTSIAQQLCDELKSTLGPLQQQLSAAERQLVGHEDAIGSCAKASVLAGVVATLQDLPTAVEGVMSRLDELAQAQRAAEGQLHAAQEQHLILSEQLAMLKHYVETLATRVEEQQGHLSGEIERVSSQLLAPVWVELQQLQESKQTLAASQARQAGAVEQLGAVVHGVKIDVISELARSKDELAQSIEELQVVISERCLKTDQLGQIFAARDNMYGAWMKMQAVFQSNKSHSGATAPGRTSISSTLFKRRPSSTLSASTSIIAGQPLTPFAPASNVAAADAVQQPAADDFDPFTDLVTRDSSHNSSCPSSTTSQDEAASAPAADPVTPAAVIAASTSQQTTSTAADSTCAAGVTPADLAAVLESQFQLRQTVAQLSEQVEALQQTQRQQTSATLGAFTAFSNDLTSAEDCSSTLDQLHAAVAQLLQQLAAVQRQQMLMTTPPATPALQSHLGLTQRSDSSAFLLALQQELAGVALQVSELQTKVQKQEVQIEAVVGAPAAVLATDTEADATINPEPALCSEPSAVCPAAAGAAATCPIADLQQQFVALAAKVADLQQQSSFSSTAESCKADTVGHKEESSDGPPQASTASVLHAPLSVMVQLQEDLASLKESQVNKDQFAAVIRMVREQKDHATTADALNSNTLSQMGNMLQQHAEQLAGVEFSIDSILSRLEATTTATADAVDSLSQQQQLQQQSSIAAIEELSLQHSKLVSDLAALQVASEQQAAALDDSSVSAQEHAYQLTSHQHTTESLAAELANMAANLEDLTAKLAAEREAHTQLASMVNVATAAATMPRRAFSEGQEASGSGFSELVAGIAKLKDCMDVTSHTVSSLHQRLEAQEAVIAELAATAQTRQTAADAALEGLESAAQVAATTGKTQEPLQHRASDSAPAHSFTDQSQAVIKANFAPKADVPQQAAELQAQVEYLKDKLAAVERQQQHHQEQHESQRHPEPTALVTTYSRSASGSGRAIDAIGSVIAAESSAISTSASFSRRVSKISSIAAADAVKLTAAAADEAAVAVAGPMALVHQILMELKKRVEALEASAAAAATVNVTAQPVQAGFSTAPVMHCNQLFVPSDVAATPSGARLGVRRPASWQTAGDAAAVAELQELVINLQQEVARIDVESNSNAANLTSLRGDVGAAAAAAAQAAAAATAASNQSKRSSIREREPAGAAAAVASFDAASIAAEASSASATAAAAQEAAAQAQAAASALQDGLRALTQELEQLQTQLAGSSISAGTGTSTIENLAAVHASAVVALQDEISGLKAIVNQISTDSIAASSRAAGEYETMSTRLWAVEEQVQQALAAAANSTETATAAVSAVGPAIENYKQLQQVQQDITEFKHQLTQCLTAATAEAVVETAVTQLRAELQALQDQVAWASSEAAAAACTAASNAVEDVKEQLVEDLQGQLDRAVARSLQSSFAGTASELAAATAAAAVDGALQEYAGAAACEVPATATTYAAQPTCNSGLTFNDLATAPSPTSRALVQQLLASIANATGTKHATADQPTVSSALSVFFKPNFSEVPQQQQLHSAAVDGGFVSLPCDSAGAAPTAAATVVGDLSSHQILGAQLGLMSAAQQVEFLCKLAGVVSSHATRLLATYQDDPALAAQLYTVQERLSAAVASTGAASKPPVRTSESTFAVSAVARRFSASSSISLHLDAMQRLDASAAGSFAAGEVLLGILDQVASLRAIGSATHPAISQALQKHEAQIAALLEAQQQLQKTRDTNTPASSSGAATLVVEVTTAQGSSSSIAPDPAAPRHATSSNESFEGEFNQRLSTLESRLASGLKVLSEVRNKLSPLREVADASQSMMRELQVAHGLVLQRLEALEGLASAGVGAAGADNAGAVQHEELASSALAVAGSLRQMQADVLSLSRRLSAAEASLASTSDCLALSRRLAARMADADNRGAQLAGKVSNVASSLPVVVERVVDLEGRLSRSLGVAKRGLDILADQLVALGALNGRGSPSKNPLAALGPNHAAMTALEGKVEAVRTAMTASVRLMISDLTTDAATAGSTKATPGLGQVELGAGLVSAQLAASEAVNAAVASHQEALNVLESKIAEMRAELHTALATAGKQQEI